ncbi:TonB-dependent receptor [Tardibacter chloracetimidivorans]|nr:TonB-dependent receptor [Tardibacter chloracetimidivorans]
MQSDAAASPAAAAAAGDNADVGEIVVTAQRRAESLEAVPIAITSIGGGGLAKSSVTSTGQLAQVVPGLRFDYSASFAQPTIRGVGTAAVGPGLNSNIATYVDGFYISSPFSTDFKLLDVDNVSVLKGPQGTLFGRNATGGAILVTTKKPTFQTTGNIMASYERFNHPSVGGFLSTGLTEKVAVSITAAYERGDNFYKNIFTGDDNPGKFHSLSFKSKILWEVSDATDVMLSYQHTDVSDPTSAMYNAYQGLTIDAFIPGSVIASKRGDISSDYDPRFKLNVDGAYLTADTDLGFGKLTSYSMYRDQRTLSANDNDAASASVFNVLYRNQQKSASQEFVLTSPQDTSRRLSWVLGANYFYDKDAQQFYAGAPLALGLVHQQTSKSFAFFGDATYELADKLFLTGGLRYSSEKRLADYLVQSTAFGTPGANDSASKTFNSLTPRAVIRYELAPRTSVYASFSKGFKSGAFNTFSIDLTTPVKPEKLTAYEVGFKTASRNVRFSTAGYYYDYTNLQLASYTSTTVTLKNAARAEVYGVEGDVSVNPVEGLEIRVAGAYTHARFKKFLGAPAQVQCLDLVSCGAFFGLFITTPIDASGFTMPRSPKFSGNVTVNYTRPLAGGEIAFSANYYRTSKIFFDPAEQFGQGAYGLLNLRVGYTLPDGHTSFAVYGTNVTDKKYVNQLTPVNFSIAQNYGQPAVYGISASYKF